MKTNNKNIGIDLTKFKKIEDIIFLDEPILTHYKRNDKDFLLYLVDTTDEIDIYLLLEVSEKIIYEYLMGNTSLLSIIRENENICYLLEQDFFGNISEIIPLQSEYIQDAYLPDDNSYLNYDPSEESYYYDFIQNYESKFYLNSLREKAFYIKFSPNNKKYQDTIGFNELVTNLLANVSNSFKSFLKSDFLLEFKYIQTDKTKLQKIYNKILPELDFRMVDLNFGSFEVGLAIDKVMKGSIEDKKVKDWAIRVGHKYKDLVLDKKYGKSTVNKILESYEEEDRRKIFEPIFKITENPNFKLQIKDNKKSSYSTISINDKKTIERIVPPKKQVEELPESKEYEIIKVVTVHEKTSKSKSIRLDDNTLFDSTDTTDYVLKNKDFEKYGYKIDTPINTTLKISTEKDKIILSTEYLDNEFEAVIDNGKIDDGIKEITSAIYDYLTDENNKTSG